MGPQTSSNVSGGSSLKVLISLLLCLALIWGAALERQNIYDWWRLRGYQAPLPVAALASQDTMTAYARRIFYVNYPTIDTGTSFNQPCPNDGGEKSIVLGCYHGGQRGIFLLSVNDPLLKGVEQVTAAHEMLHAAYERLGPSERQKLDVMLLDYYHHGLHDPRIQDTINAYKQTEPNDVVNEMHSVFGTEIAQLPAPLEQYYQRYFSDRATVAAYAARYQAEFTSRQDTVQQDDTRLATMKTQIDDLETGLKAQLSTINSRQATLTAEHNSGNLAAYNAGVPGYNQLVDAYNAQANSLQNLVSQYNQLVSSRNAVALQEDHLVSELSSTVPQIMH